MSDDAHVDGNAVGGLMIDAFGAEMTAAARLLRRLRQRSPCSAPWSPTRAPRATSCAAPGAAWSCWWLWLGRRGCG